MPGRETQFEPVSASLRSLLGAEYIDAVCAARAAVEGTDDDALREVAEAEVAFFPESLQARLLAMLIKTGEQVCPPLKGSATGASTAPFDAVTKAASAPLAGLGCFRVGEGGRVHLTTKSEHYHTPLGHSFPGFRLLEHARRLGIPQATHNNTRGHVTRLLEEALIRTARGADGSERLDRVLNLQTGSLAAEAALKMILARFYPVNAGTARHEKPSRTSKSPRHPASLDPEHEGKTPVLIVVGDDEGSLEANYHGTTLLTQLMRGMWPEVLSRLEEQGLLLVRSVRPNRIDEFEGLLHWYDTGEHKVAGFFHEIVMMNYGARLLTREFLTRAYELCRVHDVPTVVDEIQSCAWYPELYLFREYGLTPDFVAVGKGFSGGEYAASRILFNSKYDNLPQFGALVTNGQEELSALAYLVTMKWVEANADVTRAIGACYEERLRGLAERHAAVLEGVDGLRHLCALRFREVAPAKAFASELNRGGIDISVQTYKAACPPAALTKLPLIAGYEVVDFLLERMDEALTGLATP